jgi:hypothetical protein
MSNITDKMSRSSQERDTGLENPKKGEHYRCEKCGMEVEVTTECQCRQPDMVHFHCCGQELQKV